MDSHLYTFIAGAKKGQDKIDYNVTGDMSPNGDFSDLQIVFNAPLGKKIPVGSGQVRRAGADQVWRWPVSGGARLPEGREHLGRCRMPPAP